MTDDVNNAPRVMRHITRYDSLPEGRKLYNPITKVVTRTAWMEERFVFDSQNVGLDINPGRVLVSIDPMGWPVFHTEAEWAQAVTSSISSGGPYERVLSPKPTLVQSTKAQVMRHTARASLLNDRLTLCMDQGCEGYCIALDEVQTRELRELLNEPCTHEGVDTATNEDLPTEAVEQEEEKPITLGDVLDTMEPMVNRLRRQYIERSKKVFSEMFTRDNKPKGGA